MTTQQNQTHFDMVIIGAGLSGIGMACHMTRRCPDKTYTILEGRDNMGGTWDLFKYPGIRSDSDMFTLGYDFKPWTSAQFLADGDSILKYIKEAAHEHGVNQHIRYNSWVDVIKWCSERAVWTIKYLNKAQNSEQEISCNFINICTGYYNYEHGYEPVFPGSENFNGTIVHPQKWPEDLAYENQKVVVIGSGATAVTLVPELSRDARQVTMLQRSPTYMISVPRLDPFVNVMQRFLPDKWLYTLNRGQKVGMQMSVYHLSRRFPKLMSKLLELDIKRQLGNSADMKHFKPRYNPWDERLCAVKGGDLFKAIKKGRVSVVTDHIDRFTERGILLKSGRFLEADVIVTATGLDLKFAGDIEIFVDNARYDHTTKMNYKGVMFEDLPNLGMTFGYTNASWTLKADLTSQFLCRIMRYMDKNNYKTVTPRNHDSSVAVDPDFLPIKSGYILRSLDKLPKVGNKMPWKLYQNYPLDLTLLRYGKLPDDVLEFRPIEG